ncbi:hypothetical protein PGB90_007515 [Kerria lacca]
MKLILILLLISFVLSTNSTLKIKGLDWWQQEVIYQIYPRSFKDSNNDGIGDLRGIYQKLTYLKSLGVGCIWLSPILKSPMADFGYDVSNFREIDPIFGTMDDFDMLIRKARKLGLKVIMDYVPNHTSEKHEWFIKSVERIPPYTDYYIWRDAKYQNGKRYPPNNWLSNFGKSAWEWNEKRNQYYFHQFGVQQPDLNYRNPVVFEEMKNNVIFWLDKGIDGLRIDSVDYLYESEEFLDEPPSHVDGVSAEEYAYLNHTYTRFQPENIALIQTWREVFDRYSARGSTKFMVTEAYGKAEEVIKFFGISKRLGAHFPFNFLFITNVNKESNAIALRDIIQNWYKHMPHYGWGNWVIGNHDNPRPATRYGHFLVDGLHMLQMLLPGTAIVYNGDELGMEDTFIRWDQTVDPKALNAGPLKYQEFSRDGCRTPFQWDDTENSGFTKSLHTWLPVNPDYWRVNVKSELKNKKELITHLEIFRELVQLRKNIVFQRGDLNLYVLSNWVLAVTRSFNDHATYAIIVNLGSEITISNLYEKRPSLPRKMSVVIPSINSNYLKGHIINTNSIVLRPKASVVLTTSEEDWDIKPNIITHEDDNYKIY